LNTASSFRDVGSNPLALAAGQIRNGLGAQLLVTANAGDGSVSVLVGQGNGTFANAMSYAAGASPRAIALADMNNDSNTDILVASSTTGFVGILFGNGDGTFQSYQPLLNVGQSPSALVVADFNGDGRLDFATANAGATPSPSIWACPTCPSVRVRASLPT
jgi:hypothetical protein